MPGRLVEGRGLTSLRCRTLLYDIVNARAFEKRAVLTVDAGVEGRLHDVLDGVSLDRASDLDTTIIKVNNSKS